MYEIFQEQKETGRQSGSELHVGLTPHIHYQTKKLLELHGSTPEAQKALNHSGSCSRSIWRGGCTGATEVLNRTSKSTYLLAEAEDVLALFSQDAVHGRVVRHHDVVFHVRLGRRQAELDQTNLLHAASGGIRTKDCTAAKQHRQQDEPRALQAHIRQDRCES